MKKYRVSMSNYASSTVVVEADDKDGAIDAALDLAPYVCAHCSGMGYGNPAGIELGDWYIDEERADETVVEADEDEELSR